MRDPKNALLSFIGGLAMLVVGLYMFTSRVTVTSNIIGVISIGNRTINSGVVIIPFIICIVWMFASGGSLPSKICTGLSILLIIVEVIMNTRLSLVRISLFEWILMFVLIFGGLGLVLREMFGGNSGNGSGSGDNSGSNDEKKNNSY